MLDDGGKIDLIVTDLGGTLVKTDEAIMTAVRRAAGELGIPEGYRDPDHDVRQAKKAGVLSAAVQTGGQAVKYLHRTQAQNPHHLLDSFVGLCRVIADHCDGNSLKCEV
jgi:phosphoglycolate phosphatase-like HAD superfamily hydrolase